MNDLFHDKLQRQLVAKVIAYRLALRAPPGDIHPQ